MCHEKHCRNVSLIYNLQDLINHFVILVQTNKHPPHLLIMNYLHDPKMIRSPIYSDFELINLTRYLTSLLRTDLLKSFSYLRFLQIKYVQACAPQTDGDSLKKSFPPTRSTNDPFLCFRES